MTGTTHMRLPIVVGGDVCAFCALKQQRRRAWLPGAFKSYRQGQNRTTARSLVVRRGATSGRASGRGRDRLIGRQERRMTKSDNSARRLLRLRRASEYLSISPAKLREIVQREGLPVIQLRERSRAVVARRARPRRLG